MDTVYIKCKPELPRTVITRKEVNGVEELIMTGDRKALDIIKSKIDEALNSQFGVASVELKNYADSYNFIIQIKE